MWLIAVPWASVPRDRHPLMVSRRSPLPFKLSPKYPFPLSEQFLPWLEAFAETTQPSFLVFKHPCIGASDPLGAPPSLTPASVFYKLLFPRLPYFPLPLPPWPVGSTWHGGFSKSKQRFLIRGHCTVRITHSPFHSLQCEGQLGFLAGGVLPPYASLPRG